MAALVATLPKRKPLDKLTLTIQTDGSVSASDALAQANAILVEAFGSLDGKSAVEAAAKIVSDRGSEVGVSVDGSVDDAASLEELNISTRVLNSLKKAGIETVGDLRAKDREELLQIKNLGEKSLDEVLKKVA